MKNEWSKHWISSVQPRKQRKYAYNAPLHIMRDFLAAPLSKELKKKYLINSIITRKGDKVKVLRGQFKGRIGAIEEVQIKNMRVCIENVTYTGRDGKKKYYPIHPSKILILELNLDDKKRKASIGRSNLKPENKANVVSIVKTEKKAENKTDEKIKTTKGAKQVN